MQNNRFKISFPHSKYSITIYYTPQQSSLYTYPIIDDVCCLHQIMLGSNSLNCNSPHLILQQEQKMLI